MPGDSPNRVRREAWNRKLPSDDEVLRMALEGQTQRQIAARYGASQSSVSQVLHRYPEGRVLSNRRNPKRRWTGPELGRLVETYRRLGSVQATAREMQTNKQTVRRALGWAGVSIHSQSAAQSGARNPSWKGGVTREGKCGRVLVLCPDHPGARTSGYVYRSRLMMEDKLGRTLHPTEVVHHLNGCVTDDRPENLELFASNGRHLARTLKGRVPRWSAEGTDRIAAARKRLS